MLCGVADQVREDLRQEVVGEDRHREPVVVDAEVGEVGDLLPDQVVEVNGCKSGPALADLADSGDVCGDLDALSDPVFQFPGVAGRFPLEFVDEKISVDVCDVVGVPDIVGEDIEVEVRLLVCRFKPPVEHPPHDAGPDLPADRLEKRTLVVGEKSPVPAPDEEHPDDVGLDDKRDAGECGKPEFPEETGGGGVRLPVLFEVAGKAGGQGAGE